MTKRVATTLAAVQLTMNCSHCTKLGEPCDVNSGGWWSCGCEIYCWKANKQDENSSGELARTEKEAK